MTDDCYACTHAADDVPLRERVVRRNGWRVAIDFNSGLEGWLILARLGAAGCVAVTGPRPTPD